MRCFAKKAARTAPCDCYGRALEKQISWHFTADIFIPRENISSRMLIKMTIKLATMLH